MSAKVTVCRVSMIPGGDADYRKAELYDSIQRALENDELQHLNAIKISIVRSYDSQTFTAQVQFENGLPEFLKRAERGLTVYPPIQDGR